MEKNTRQHLLAQHLPLESCRGGVNPVVWTGSQRHGNSVTYVTGMLRTRVTIHDAGQFTTIYLSFFSFILALRASKPKLWVGHLNLKSRIRTQSYPHTRERMCHVWPWGDCVHLLPALTCDRHPQIVAAARRGLGQLEVLKLQTHALALPTLNAKKKESLINGDFFTPSPHLCRLHLALYYIRMNPILTLE